MGMLRVCVMTRNNDLIMKVLSHLKNEKKSPTRSVVADGDLKIEGKKSCLNCNSEPFKYAVLLTTIKNDIETLRGLKRWFDENVHCRDGECWECDCPMVIACIENYNQCIQILYDMNYRILIPEKCKKKINQIIDVNNHDQDEEKRRTGIRPFLKVGGKCQDSEEKFSDEDVIVKLLNLKAYTNFHYLAAEFNEAIEKTRKARKNLLTVTNSQNRKLMCSDPMRKSLAIAHYTGSNLAKNDMTYRYEFKEIMKV